MALANDDLFEVLDAIRAGGDLDVIRRSVELVLQALIEAEATEVIGAEPNERTPARRNQRNGGRDRQTHGSCERNNRESCVQPVRASRGRRRTHDVTEWPSVTQ
jgi:transposase-like protein